MPPTPFRGPQHVNTRSTCRLGGGCTESYGQRLLGVGAERFRSCPERRHAQPADVAGRSSATGHRYQELSRALRWARLDAADGSCCWRPCGHSETGAGIASVMHHQRGERHLPSAKGIMCWTCLSPSNCASSPVARNTELSILKSPEI